MTNEKHADEFRRTCLAHRTGACSTGPCVECGPVHQALRIASAALSRWPRPLPKPKPPR